MTLWGRLSIVSDSPRLKRPLDVPAYRIRGAEAHDCAKSQNHGIMSEHSEESA
jgi:hypothetical protein